MAENFNARAWFERKVESLSREARDAVKDAGKSGENLTKHNIETRGTARSGKRGRVETGRMRDSVTSSFSGNKYVSVSRFGWLEEEPFYAIFQELGFEHRSGVQVEGMYALSDAGEEVWMDLQRDIDRIVKDS